LAVAVVLLGLFLTWLSPGAEPLTEETWPLFLLMGVTLIEIGLFVGYTRVRQNALNWTGGITSTAAEKLVAGAAAVASGAAGLAGAANARLVPMGLKRVTATAGNATRRGAARHRSRARCDR